MTHPTLDDLLAGDEQGLAHVAGCADCRRLATLAGLETAPAFALGTLELPPVERAIYDDWTPLAEGRGGMGTVFRARDRRLGRHVAIKQIRGGSAGARSALRARFEREARLTARLQHPSIVGVHEAGRFADGEPFYAMPLVSGTPLGKEITKRAALVERMALLPNVAAVAEAIAFAHSKGIVHRDIKPDNILVGSFGETVVIDWGLAKAIGDTSDDPLGAGGGGLAEDGLTQLGVGTAQYMPPEQSRGDDPDVRVDVYAVGATLYHVLAGAPPYGEREGTAVRRALDAGPPRPLTEIIGDVPPELADIVARAMAREREVRYASAQELADELRRYLNGQLLRSRRYTPGELVRHFARRHRTALRVIAAALVVLVAGGILAFVRVSRERDRARVAQQRAELELRRARGTVASRLAADPVTRFDALAMAIGAVAPDLRAGRHPAPEAFQGLLDALTVGPMLVSLEHEGVIKGTVFAADEILGIDDSRALFVWDARSGEVRARVPLQQLSPEYADESPDRAQVVICGFNRMVEVVDRATRSVRRFEEGNNPASCAFLPDGRLFVAADDLTVRDPRSFAIVAQAGLPAPASGVAIDARGRIAVTTLDGTLLRWTPGAAPERLASGASATMMLFGPDGTLYQNGADHVIRAWADDVVPGTPGRVVFEDRRMNWAQTIANGESGDLAIAMFDADLARATVVLDTAGRTRCQLDTMAQGWIGRDWVISERYGPIEIVDVTTCRPILTLAEVKDETAGRVNPGPRGLRLVSADRDGKSYLFDVRSGRASGMLLAHSGEVVAVAPSPHGDRVLTAAHDGRMIIWRASDGAQIASNLAASELLTAAWVDDALVVAGDLDGGVRAIAPDTGAVVANARLGGPVGALAIADGRIAVGTLAGDLILTDRTLGATVTLASPGPVTALAWSRDGRRLVSGHAGSLTVLWDATNGRQLARHDADAGDDDRDGHATLAFTLDDASVLAGRPDGTTRAFRAADLRDATTADRVLAGVALSPERAQQLAAGHRGSVLAVARSADGRRLVSAGLDGHVRVWDAATGAALASIATPQHGAATSVAFIDADHVIVGHHTGAVRVHPVTPSAAVAHACALVHDFGRGAQLAPHCDRSNVDR